MKCFCPVILKVYVLLYYIPYRGRIFQRKAKLSKTRSAGSKLVIVGVWIVKMFFPTLIVSHILFLESHRYLKKTVNPVPGRFCWTNDRDEAGAMDGDELS